MSNAKCKMVDGIPTYCVGFSEFIKIVSESEIGEVQIGSNVKIGNVTAAFNRCPYCKEWIPKEKI